MMILDQLYEGLMKRSDPVVSGDQEEPMPPISLLQPLSPFKARMLVIANQANVPLDQVIDAWHVISKEVDPKLTARWAIINKKMKVKFNL